MKKRVDNWSAYEGVRKQFALSHNFTQQLIFYDVISIPFSVKKDKLREWPHFIDILYCVRGNLFDKKTNSILNYSEAY